jgi:hypothetical protein
MKQNPLALAMGSMSIFLNNLCCCVIVGLDPTSSRFPCQAWKIFGSKPEYDCLGVSSMGMITAN